MVDRLPNVFVLSVDSLRADAYHELMGSFAGLVEGVDFADAVATANATGSSMPTLAAGVYTDRIASGTPNLKLGEAGESPEVTTMAEALSRAGYDCWLWSANTIFGSARQYDRGFEGGRAGEATWKKRVQELVQRKGSTRLFNLGRWLYFNVFESVKHLLTDDGTYYPSGRTYHRSVLESLDGDSGGQMHWIHYMDVHHPFDPPAEYFASRTFNTDWNRARLAELSSKAIIENRGADISDEDVEDVSQAYLACVEYLRDQLTEFVETLLDRGHFVPGHDVLVLTADHGEGFDRDRYGMLGHTPTPAFWEDLVRVPLVVSHPDWEPDTVSRQVSLIDLMPTVLDAVGVNVPDTVDGRTAKQPREMCRDYAYFTATGPYRTYHGIRSESGWKLFSDRINEADSVELTGTDEANDYERVVLTEIESSRAERSPVESDPIESDPIESGPVENDPIEHGPVDRGPVESGPIEPGSVVRTRESIRFECELTERGRPSGDADRTQWATLLRRLVDTKGSVATRRFDETIAEDVEEQLRQLGYVDDIR